MLCSQYNANRIAESLFVAAQYSDVDVVIDPFMDLDRGHSVRSGVIDRFGNPRPAGNVVKFLHSVLATQIEPTESIATGLDAQGRWLASRSSTEIQVLFFTSAESH